MINKSYQPLFVVTHLCTDHLPGGQRTSHRRKLVLNGLHHREVEMLSLPEGSYALLGLAYFLSIVEEYRPLSQRTGGNWA